MIFYNLTRGTLLGDKIEVAKTPELKRIGLLHREKLASGGGLWIKGCNAIHTIGMKFPIDVLFIDRLGEVLAGYLNVLPGQQRLEFATAASVLELPAGTIAATRTWFGDRIAEIDVPDLGWFQYSPEAMACS